jgi:hypothetical protein
VWERPRLETAVVPMGRVQPARWSWLYVGGRCQEPPAVPTTTVVGTRSTRAPSSPVPEVGPDTSSVTRSKGAHFCSVLSVHLLIP